MDKVIAYTDPSNGGLAIVYPAPQARKRILVSPAIFATKVVRPADEDGPEEVRQVLVKDEVWRDQTDDEFLADVIAGSNIPAGATPVVMNRSDVPADRTLRAGWRLSNGRIVEDLSASREAAKASIRAARAPVLEDLDAKWIQATEKGDKAAADAVVTEKQRLRDLPTAADAATTPAALKSLIASVRR